MTRQECYENYKYDRAAIFIKRIKTEETKEREIDRIEALDLAIGSLEKQILRKPLQSFQPYFYWCPQCSSAIKKRAECNTRTINNCPYCGQALDWGDTN